MKIKNFELNTFAHLLYDMKLSGKKSRMRTKLLKILEVSILELQENEMALVKEYAVHNEQGEIEFTDEAKTQFMLNEMTIENYHKEKQILFNEAVVIEENEANKDMLLTVAEAFLDGDVQVSQNDATIYDNICEEFEAVIEKYSHNGE